MEKYYKIWEPVLENFKHSYPELYEKMVDWYPSGYLEITVKLDDGQLKVYEFMGDFVRTIKSIGEVNVEDVEESEWRLIFADRLRTRMRRSGIGQEELSNRSGISRVTLSNYMNGKATPSGYNLERLSRALNCSVSQLASL